MRTAPSCCLQQVLTIRLRDAWNRAPLHLAFADSEQHVQCLAALLAAGADPCSTTPSGSTELHAAAFLGKARIARLLVQAAREQH